MMPDRPREGDDLHVGSVFRNEYGRAVSVLVRMCGDIDLAEDGVQEAFTIAAQRWCEEGVPPSPAGWIITTARHKIIDRLRREASRQARQAQAALLQRGHGPTQTSPCRTTVCA